MALQLFKCLFCASLSPFLSLLITLNIHLHCLSVSSDDKYSDLSTLRSVNIG